MEMRTGLLAVVFSLLAGAVSGGESEARFPPEGLVGYWSFDEGRGTVARDAEGWIGDFALMGNPKWIENASGHCILLDNAPEKDPVYLELPSFRPFNQKMESDACMIETGAISLWARPIRGGLYEDPVSGRSAGCLWYATLMISGKHWMFNMGDPEMGIVMRLMAEPVRSGEWTHVVATWDAMRARLYVNGELARQPGGEVLINIPKLLNVKSPFRVGLAYPGEKANRYVGYLDEIRYYARMLDASEVKHLYAAEREKVLLAEKPDDEK